MNLLLLLLIISISIRHTCSKIDLRLVCEEQGRLLDCNGRGDDNYVYPITDANIVRIHFRGAVDGKIDIGNLPSLNVIESSDDVLGCSNLINAHMAVTLYNMGLEPLICQPSEEQTESPTTITTRNPASITDLPMLTTRRTEQPPVLTRRTEQPPVSTTTTSKSQSPSTSDDVSYTAILTITVPTVILLILLISFTISKCLKHRRRMRGPGNIELTSLNYPLASLPNVSDVSSEIEYVRGEKND